MTEQSTQGLAWCKIHLVPQNDNHAMPPYVVGILTQETASHYVVMKMLEQVETEDFDIEIVHSENMNFINKTYVWRLEMLKEPPQLGGFGEVYNGNVDGLGGGLG